MKKFMKTTIVWFALIAVVFCTCKDDSDSGNSQPDNKQPNYNMTGTYTFSNTGGICTWIFTADGYYQCTGYGFTGKKTGTWSASGNDVTISYAAGSTVSGKEVFTVQANGNQLTLTLKDTSALTSLVLNTFMLNAKSVTLTKTSSSGIIPPDYNMAGTYTFSNTGGSCTWTFYYEDYSCKGYGFSGTKTGTWKSSGNDVTISYAASSDIISISGEEVFTVQENGNQITLTLKDNSAQTSLVLNTFMLAAKSVTLQKIPEVTFISVTANGSAYQTTTQLTLTFSQAISGLSASDITLSGVSGVTKGTLIGSGPTYTLEISGFYKRGRLNIAVNKSGYIINNSTKEVTIYFYYSGVSPGTIEMVPIPAGTFTMGSPTTESGRYNNETQHSVALNGFSMSKYQVTQEQYQAVIGYNPSYFTLAVTGESGTPGKLPVENVSWYDAVEFCNKLSIIEGLNPVYSLNGKTNPTEWGERYTWEEVLMDKSKNGYRLPTEAEWEYACRAGTTTAYNTGDTISDNTGWYNSNSGNKTHQVGLKTVNTWGLYDMHGNVWEWCWDWYGDYSSSSENNPIGPVTGSDRVLRGGSYYNLLDSVGNNLRSAFRGGYDPNAVASGIGGGEFGLRLVRP